MFSPQGPSLRELAMQALSSVEGGYDLLAPKFDHTPFRTPDSVLDATAGALRSLRPFGRGLDVCCGTGAGMRALRSVCQGRVTGVDFSAGMLAKARCAHPDATWVRADARALPFAGGFDVAHSFGALGHFLPAERPALFAGVYRACRHDTPLDRSRQTRERQPAVPARRRADPGLRPTFARPARGRRCRERLAAMSADPKVPPAPRLRAIREAWLGRATVRLEADQAVSAAGLVGSLGRGDADDWSDIDLLIVVPDGQVDQYADQTRLPGSEQAVWSIDGLPLLNHTFREHQDKREIQPPTPKAANAHRLLQVSLVPVAGKYVARRSPDAGRMVQFVGGPYAPGASPAEHLATLRQLLVQYREEAPQEMLAANSRYLDLVATAL